MSPRSRFSQVAFPAVSALLLFATTLVAQQPPPSDLRLVDNHWTAWDSQTEVPDGAQIHIVRKGDTLWDLAEQFYGDPYLWPQLWERNQHILDAHWIYPGDSLVVGVEVTPIEDLETLASASGAAAPGTEDDGRMDFESSLGDPVPLGGEEDIYCSGFIGERQEAFPYRLLGSEYDNLTPVLAGRSNTTKLNLSTGDIVYLASGRNAGLLPGSLFTVVKPMDLVRHPGDGGVVGRFYSFRGRVRVLSVQEETAIAEITFACHSIEGDDMLMPFSPQPIPLARRSGLIGVNDPVTRERLESAGWIVHSDEGIVSLGQGNTVFIESGDHDEMTPGDFFTIYRETISGQPPMILGELAVLSVGEQTALAMILESRYTIRVGDRVEPKSY